MIQRSGLPGAGQDLSFRIAAHVRRGRRRHGWSQLALAERASISVNHVGLIERARRLPSIEVALRLAAALGTTLERLVLGPPRRESWSAEVVALLRALPDDVLRVVLAMLRAAAAAVRRP